MVLLNISLPSPHIPSQPCYKKHNRTQQNTTVQSWDGNKKWLQQKQDRNTRHNIFWTVNNNCHGPQGKGQRRLRPRPFRGSGQACPLAVPWALLQEQEGRRCWGAGQDPSSHSEVQVTDWSAFGWGEMSRPPRERDAERHQGPQRPPLPRPMPVCEKVSWALPERVHGLQEPARLYSHGISLQVDRGSPESWLRGPTHKAQSGLAKPPGPPW